MHIFTKTRSRTHGKVGVTIKYFFGAIGCILLSVLFIFAWCRFIAKEQISLLGNLVYCSTVFFPSDLGLLEDGSSRRFVLMYTFTPRYVDGCFLKFDVFVSPMGQVVQELFPYSGIDMSSKQRYDDARKLLEQAAMDQRHCVEEGKN